MNTGFGLIAATHYSYSDLVRPGVVLLEIEVRAIVTIVTNPLTLNETYAGIAVTALDLTTTFPRLSLMSTEFIGAWDCHTSPLHVGKAGRTAWNASIRPTNT